mmetsp:Transcript_89486/g.213846  ORF Transcript_89486/g.213846 Transcript_89486/m.213846 type:complete len:203 (-) Transcript_89486:79-687(-)
MPANKKKKAETPPSSDDEPEGSESGSSEAAAAPKKKNLFALMMDSDEEDSDEEEEEEEEEENFWNKDELELRERGRCQGFTWEASGSGREVLVRVPLADDVRVKSINVDITSTSVKCRIGDEVIVEGTLFAPVLTDDSFWDLEKRGKKAFLLITLGKLDSSRRWDSLLEGGDPGSPSDAAPEVEVMNMDEVLAEIRGAKSAT